MGVHTGDSITVAPIQTLTDKEYEIIRDASIRVMRRIGVDTGGSNVQFAINPQDGRLIIIEMNPRVSRSSALASKATGFPIAKMAAKLAVGYTLDEIPNDITRETPACFEPSIDYVVAKIPRFNFEKFPLADSTLGTQMKSVGEVLSFGRNFSEALQKAICSLELDSNGFDREALVKDLGRGEILEACKAPSAQRIWLLAEALRAGHTPQTLYRVTGIDLWFLTELQGIVRSEEGLKNRKLSSLTAEELLALKRQGFSDGRLAALLNVKPAEVCAARRRFSLQPCYKAVDTCAAEFAAETPYLYSSYDSEDEAPARKRKKIVILGSGPNRIGQGIEFDYCCVHAAMALREDGYETVMINCNPETVSTDYDISDRLYFEPLTFESVMNIVDREKPDGVIVQFGGQTPLRLAGLLELAGVPIIGTAVESIDIAEDRKLFAALIEKLKLRQPVSRTVASREEALQAAAELGFPILMRPSFVLGGRAMRVVYSLEEIENWITESVQVSYERPVLLDRFLSNAVEVDVDLVCDGKEVLIAGVMEHIEKAGIHSGDSSCTIPPQSLSVETVGELKAQAAALALSLEVVGLMNVQFAVDRQGLIYVLEANPRASRTVPFVSKATGIPWAKAAARLMAGRTIADLGLHEARPGDYVATKACVFPFNRFPGVDTILGPEMKSTGEVMGIHRNFQGSFAKALFSVQSELPSKGTAFLSIRDSDKEEALEVARRLADLGFKLVATHGTAQFLNKAGLSVERINKVREGSPHVLDLLGQGGIDLIVNTPEGSGPLLDSRSIRLVANELRVPTYTTISASLAVTKAIAALGSADLSEVRALQDYHA